MTRPPSSFVGALVLALLAACVGDEGSECRAKADCNDGLECAGPNLGSVCGIPPMESCSSDADCTLGGLVCHAVPDTCSPDGVGSECRLACTSDAGCGEGFRCDLDRGACVAIPCDDGYACPSEQACEPSDPSLPIHAIAHGCVAIACEGDADCADGGDGAACVNGICQTGPGQCRAPVLVP